MQNIWPSPIKTPVVNDQENKRFATLFETKVQDSAEAFYDKLYGPVGLQLQKSPEAFRKFIQDETQKFAELIKANGLTID